MIKNMHISMFEQGKIKIGEKGEKKRSGTGKEYRESVKLEWFKITTLEKDASDNFVRDEVAMKGLPDKPTSLPVELLYDDVDLNFPTCYSIYKDGELFCRGDGETAERNGKQVVCNPETCKFAQSKGRDKCKVGGILSCRLPHLKTLGGVYKFRTHSWNSVSNLLSSMQYLQTLTGGTLAGLPLELRMAKKPTKFGLVNIVNLVFPGTQDDLAFAIEKELSRRMRLKIDLAKVEERAIRAGVTEDTDDPADISAEFYPPPEYPKTREEDQAEIDATLEKAYAAIAGLWESYDINDFERTASLKKHLHVESGDLRECRDIDRLREYYKTHKAQYAEKTAEKEDRPLDGTTQEDFDLVKNVLGDKSAKALKQAIIDNDDDTYNQLVLEARQQEEAA